MNKEAAIRVLCMVSSSIGRKDKKAAADMPVGYTGSQFARDAMGQQTASILPTALGAGISSVSYTLDESPVIGAAAGAGVNALANLVGMVAAGLTKTRTLEEQREKGDNIGAARYLIPGVATYNMFKGMGARPAKELAQKDKKYKQMMAALQAAAKASK